MVEVHILDCGSRIEWCTRDYDMLEGEGDVNRSDFECDVERRQDSHYSF